MGRFGLRFSVAMATVWMALALTPVQQAEAVHLDIGGRGQVLLYPYYTVNNHQQTLVSLTNTSSVAQAAKVRFNEGYNGRPVLDFNLFLSPFDSWTATVFALRDAGVDSDGAAILTRDTSCIAPLFAEEGTSVNGTPYAAFREFAYRTPDDGGPYTIDRTREGSIEIISMSNVAAPLASAIAHGSNGSPPTGCALVRNLQPGDVGVQSTPSGGLMGAVSIINGGQGTYLSARAEALGGFTGVGIFTYPGSIFPDLALVNDGAGNLANQATAHVFDANGKAQALTYPGPDSRSRRVDAVSAVLMADRIYNEYQISPALGAASDWVVTMPTKPFYVDTLYIGDVTPSAIPPFYYVYDGWIGGGLGRFSPTKFSRLLYSREGIESIVASGCGWICPPGHPSPSLTTTVNVIPINTNVVTESSVLGSRLVSTIPRNPGERIFSDSGWMRVNLDTAFLELHALLPSAEGKVLRGLPVIGYWASNIVNNNIGNGVLANYAAAVRHATSVTCVKESDGSPCD